MWKISMVALLWPAVLAAEPAITGVVDGDTFWAVVDQPVRVRLKNAHAPDFYPRAACDREVTLAGEARQFVKDRIGSALRVQVTTSGAHDHWNRPLVIVTIDGRDLGALLIEAGLAVKRDRRGIWCR